MNAENLFRIMTDSKYRNFSICPMLIRTGQFSRNPEFANAVTTRLNTFIQGYAPSKPHLDLRQTAWYVLPQTGIM